MKRTLWTNLTAGESVANEETQEPTIPTSAELEIAAIKTMTDALASLPNREARGRVMFFLSNYLVSIP